MHYTNKNMNDNQYAHPVTGDRYALPDETHLFDIPASSRDTTTASFGSFSLFYDYHWNNLQFKIGIGIPIPGTDLKIKLGFAHEDVSDYVKSITRASNRTVSMREMSFTLQFHNLLDPGVLAQLAQDGGSQAGSALAL
eukprot:g8229.t1